MSKYDDRPTEWTLDDGAVPTIKADTHDLASARCQKVRALEELRQRDTEGMAGDLQRALG
jgi:hypothetical protein